MCNHAMRLVIILCLLAAAGKAHADNNNVRMAPDGTYVGGEPHMAPDGTYVGGEPEMAPDGTYVGSGD